MAGSDEHMHSGEPARWRKNAISPPRGPNHELILNEGKPLLGLFGQKSRMWPSRLAYMTQNLWWGSNLLVSAAFDFD